MFSKVISSAVFGVEGRRIDVEADLNDGLPVFSMVGYLASSVKEAAERVRTALKNSGFHLPPKRITVNLSPADLRKDGSGFDLAIAVAVLLAQGLSCVRDLEHMVLLGELGLDGSVRPVRGVLPMVSHCASEGVKVCMVPWENVREASFVPEISVVGVKNLGEAVAYLRGEDCLQSQADVEQRACGEEESLDFSDVKGQEHVKRGLEIAASGFHNVLLSGSAGAGKSMLVKRLPTIMPEMSYEESLAVTKIYSVGGLLNGADGLVRKRPFRAPHHTVSETALVGGGAVPRPGEVSYSHCGVLFLDELPEFGKSTLEVLRQPLEDGTVTISRLSGTYVFPADFMLVAAMNPCPCGFFPDRSRCSCTDYQIRRYQTKLSGPLLDRIDIRMEIQGVKEKELFSGRDGESSKQIRQRVERAREIQKHRYRQEAINFNSQLDGRMLHRYITLSEREEDVLRQAFQTGRLSARGVDRILKLARTIADMEGAKELGVSHLQEALFYRNDSSKLMGGELYAGL